VSEDHHRLDRHSSAVGAEGLPDALSVTGLIFDIKRYAIHDGPGIRSTVFFKGCPLRCQWCHNPESWLRAPELAWRMHLCLDCGTCIATCQHGAISRVDGHPVTDSQRCVMCGECIAACPTEARQHIGRLVTVGELVDDLERDAVFYDESGGGITCSGGEPLAQPIFLEALLRSCRARGLHTTLDTTLHAPWPIIDSVAPHIDLFYADLKHMDAEAHRQYTGVGNERILANLERLAATGAEIVIRVPVVPGVNDGDANIEATGRFVASLRRRNGRPRIDLLPYHPMGREKLERLQWPKHVPLFERPCDDHLRHIAQRLEGFGLAVHVGG